MIIERTSNPKNETIKFVVGKTYPAEFPILCYYKGHINEVGTNWVMAYCKSRTDKSVTFEIYGNDGTLHFTKRGKIQYVLALDDKTKQEFVYLKNNGQYKDMYIQSEQYIKG